MTSLEMENPGPGANQETGADTEARTQKSSTTRSAQQAWHDGSRLLTILATWIIRLAHRMREREIQHGWDAALSLQLDRPTVARECLADYLRVERGQQ